MVEYVNVVVCRHPNCNKNFIFRAPDNSSKALDVGDYILVNTSKGPNQVAQCITPAFRVADFHLKEFYGVEVKDLKPVTAYMKPICFTWKDVLDMEAPCEK